ncbi:hypothetical protein JCM3775_000222 [Rhodotorula graminis]|uniref:Uncharacterized protein n=1 Tax=Rhodotorula graminis (strain WP1) TaxID=578459 RepID=A0A0P9EX52_RHOGW|nr:uncharacterized protein RHOBADRAFT_37869 [Rhodotorula graminis WP1]KPV74002.1 hypothetical protein RHOBADRAFT_37869 [Rhodotorula graminis WP1]
MSDVEDACGPESVGKVPLRIAAIFVILVTSLVGTMFPILSKRVGALRRIVPGGVFDFAKFFGSGVILATGLIHLLEPSTDALGEGNTRSAGGCISDAWAEYPYPFGLCLLSLFGTFVVQIVCFRLGTERMQKMTGGVPPHIHVAGHGGHVDVPPPSSPQDVESSPTTVSSHDLEKKHDLSRSSSELEAGSYRDAMEENPVAASLIGVLTLEFGVVLHSVLIGLTLSTTSDDEVTTLFIVIVFHQMFEGLGLGTRLAFLKLDHLGKKYALLPWFGALLYSSCTPIGMAIGLGLREGISMSSGTASVVSGVLDATSSGILLYTATVELIAHEFIFNKFYHTCSWTRLWFSIGCFALGAGIMALLGKWA